MARRKLTRQDHLRMAALLRKAKTFLSHGLGDNSRKPVYVCYAVMDAANEIIGHPCVSYEERRAVSATRERLRTWIGRLMGDCTITLELWMQRKCGGFPDMRTMQEIRHQWVDWMIATLEEE